MWPFISLASTDELLAYDIKSLNNDCLNQTWLFCCRFNVAHVITSCAFFKIQSDNFLNKIALFALAYCLVYAFIWSWKYD